MINTKLLITNFDDVKTKLASRGYDVSKLIELQDLTKKRNELMSKVQKLEAQRNEYSKKIGATKAAGGDVEQILSDVAGIKTMIENIKVEEVATIELFNEKMAFVPNLPSANTPIGKDESENTVIVEHSELGKGLITGVKPHYEFAVEKDMVDFDRAVKLSGSRFWMYKGIGAKLVRALEDFMLETHTNKGYVELMTPVIVKSSTMKGTGQLPKFADDLFKIEGRDSYLIPTAEVTLTNYYAGEIVDLSTPIMLTGYTPCFRAEAGSGGKDMKGLIRSHQFNKVELVKIVTKEQLGSEYTKTVDDAKSILELLELPFRELQLCTGDIGFSAEETIDLEVWIPSEKTYREISSVSSFGDFQGRRASIRYKHESKNTYAYTINGSGLAIDRTIAAILENYQTTDGKLKIPKVLQKYFEKTEY